MEASSVDGRRRARSSAIVVAPPYSFFPRNVAAVLLLLLSLALVVVIAGSSSLALPVAAAASFVPGWRHSLPHRRYRSPQIPQSVGGLRLSFQVPRDDDGAADDPRRSTRPRRRRRRSRSTSSLGAKARKGAIRDGTELGSNINKRKGKGKKRGNRRKDDDDDHNSLLARTPREVLDRIEAAVGGGGRDDDRNPDTMIMVAPRGGRLYQYVMKAGVDAEAEDEVTTTLTDGRSESESGSEYGSIGVGASGEEGGGNNGGGGLGGLDPRNVDSVLDYLVRLLPDRLDVARDVLTEHPRILRRSVVGQLEPTVEFLRGLYGDDMLVEALSRNPSLLLVSGIGYRGRRRDGGGVDGGGNGGGDVDAMEGFLRFELGMTPASVLSLKRTSPRLFQLSVERTVRPTLLFLSGILVDEREGVNVGGGGTVAETVSEDHGSTYTPTPSSLADLSDDVKGRLRRLVRTNPALLSLDVERNLEPTVDFLRNVCHLDDGGGLGTLVRSCPSVLGLSVEDNLRHTVQFLAEDVGLGAGVDGLGRCLRRHPQILALSVDNLREKVEFFRGIELGHVGLPLGGEGSSSSSEEEEGGAVSSFGADDAGPPRSNSSSLSPPPSNLTCRVAIGAPSTFSLSLRENIVPKVEALRNIWGEESLPRLLSEYPPVLTLSLQGNIQPTISFFNRTGYVLLDENGCNRRKDIGTEIRGGGGDRDTIIRPRYLAASLYNRLLPRWHYLHEVGICAAATHSEGALPALHVLAGSNDVAFCKYFRIDAGDYAQFREEAIPKLKFSSQFETWIKTGRPIDDLT